MIYIYTEVLKAELGAAELGVNSVHIWLRCADATCTTSGVSELH